MLVFRKIWRALFSWNTHFEIHPFALLPMSYCNHGVVYLNVAIYSPSWKFLIDWNFTKESTVSQVLSCDFCGSLWHCIKYLISWCDSLAEKHNFPRVSCVFTKFSHQEIRRNLGLFRSVISYTFQTGIFHCTSEVLIWNPTIKLLKTTGYFLRICVHVQEGTD